MTEASGSDQTTPDILRYAEQFFIDDKIDAPDPDRNFEPFGELGMVRQEDVDWQDQTGSPDDPQAGNDPGQRDIMRRELWMAEAPKGNQMNAQLADLEAAEADFVAAALANPDLTADEIAAMGTEPVILSYQPETVSDEVIIFGDFDPSAMDIIDISTTVEVAKAIKGLSSNAYLVFDHQTDADYKFAGVDVQRNKAQVGMKVGDDWVILAEVQLNLSPDTPYDLNVVIEGDIVRLSVDGVEVLVYDFDEDLMDGQIGIASDNAVAEFTEVDIVAEPAETSSEPTGSEPPADGGGADPADEGGDGSGEIDWGDTGVDDGSGPADEASGGEEGGATTPSSDASADEDDAVIVVESWLPRTDFESSMIA